MDSLHSCLIHSAQGLKEHNASSLTEIYLLFLLCLYSFMYLLIVLLVLMEPHFLLPKGAKRYPYDLPQNKLRRSMAKLELYRKFTNTLAVSVLLSIAWIGYELYFNATDPLSELWQRAWMIPAFWNILSYMLLAIICILWAPSQNPTRYAYSEDTGDDFDEEGISLTGSGVEGMGDMVNKLERKERKTTDHVFGLGDELEEDKRE